MPTKIYLRRNFGLLIVVLIMSAVAVMFNNCGGPKGGAASDSSVSGAAILGGEFSGRITGELTVIEPTGLVMGYAYDASNSDKSMRVHIVLDGAEGAGIYLGETIANRLSPGRFTGHYFQFQLPANYANGVSHTLYAYGHEIRSTYRLPRAPMTYVAFTPRAQAVFNSSGLSTYVSNTCNRCHDWSYQSLFYSALISPAPNAGGSATNNRMINQISGSHGGNSPFCSTKSVFPCSAIQQWWTAEFR